MTTRKVFSFVLLLFFFVNEKQFPNLNKLNGPCKLSLWAVFMLVVAFKYYQQRMAEEWNEQDEVEVDEMQENPKKANQAQGNGFHHRQRSGPVSFEVNRERRTKRTL